MRYQLPAAAQQYLATLRRVPDDIILATATREFDMLFGNTCLCGWFVNEALARLTGQPAEAVVSGQSELLQKHFGDWDRPRAAAKSFGGSTLEWLHIYDGVLDDDRLPDIELAFTERVLEAVGS